MINQTVSTSRFAACIEYCGKYYCGWQRQSYSPSVQATVEKAISKIANEEIQVVTAGRTDTGVHGIGQIIHFDTNSQRSPYEWQRGTNTYLPNDISLIWAVPVGADFHARFSALERSYRYVILNRSTSPSYLNGRVLWHPQYLDAEAMQNAATALVGRHDFSAFQASGCQSQNPIKEVKSLRVSSCRSWIWIDIVADSFLYHMVRNIAGVLIRIGEKLAQIEWAQKVLLSRDRKQAGITAPPEGLYFVSIKYEKRYCLPDTPEVCRFW